MHILLAILGVMGAAAFWWYRLKYMSDAANEVAGAVGHVRGNYRRAKLRQKASLSPISAIDDPVVAATTLMMSMAAEDVLISEALEKRVAEQIGAIAASPAKAEEAVIYAKWAAEQVDDVPVVIDRICEFLQPQLDENEKEELTRMVLAVTPSQERHALFPQRMDRLRRRLGLVPEKTRLSPGVHSAKF